MFVTKKQLEEAVQELIKHIHNDVDVVDTKVNKMHEAMQEFITFLAERDHDVNTRLDALEPKAKTPKTKKLGSGKKVAKLKAKKNK